MNFKHLLGLLLLTGFLASCETEIDITADYQRIPVVYGLLDQQVDTQFIMINRTFLGSGNANEMAQIEDSMLYQNVDARIDMYDGNTLERSVTLHKIVRNDKDINGVFYSPTNTVYYALSTDFWPEWVPNATDDDFEALYDYSDPNFKYKLEIEADGDIIQAETGLTNVQGAFGTGIIEVPTPHLTSSLNLVNNFSPDGSTYSTNGLGMKWNSTANFMVRNGRKQKVTLRFHYTEVDINDVATEKFIDMPYTQFDGGEVNTTGSYEFVKSGEFLYRNIGDRIESNSDVKYRAVGQLEFILTAAGDDFTTYLNLGSPVSDVGQSRPSFSNINNGDGVGIFSSRDTYSRVKNIFLNGNSAEIQELVNGQYTQDFCFCDPDPGSTFDCASPSNQCQ